MYDHVDQRVADLPKARQFYGALMNAMGFTQFSEGADGVCWYHPQDSKGQAFFSLLWVANHRPNETRIAFRASDRAHADRLAEIARAAGAQSFEAPHECTDYTAPYYAAFFEDTDGNKLEICCRR